MKRFIRALFSVSVLLLIVSLLPAAADEVRRAKEIPVPVARMISSSASETAPGCGSAWRRIKSPSPAHQAFDANQLSGVYALTSADVWAVGWSLSYSDGHYRTLAEHWDGTRWKVVPTPNSSQPNNYLQAVSAVSPDDVWAVGQQDDGVGDSWTLAEHWDGKAWTIDERAKKPGSLGGVVASSATEVWASGFGLEHWDGAGWTLQKIGAANYLRDVSGSAGDLWAVGYRTVQPSGPLLTLTEHWDGSAWTRHGAVNPLQGSTDDENVLNGVAAPPGDDHPWAVGYFANFDGGPKAHTLVERWNGAKWTRLPAPNPGGSKLDNELWDVTALSSADAWAVGSVSDGGSNSRTMIEQWDGKSWTAVKSPSRGTLLRIASDQTTGNLWAVGAIDASNYQATLIMEACGR